MCKVLKISRSSYYAYEEKARAKDKLSEITVKMFNENQHVYGTRKLKVELAKQGLRVSRRRIARIMRQNGLVSAYTIKKYKPQKDSVNEEEKPNIVDRQFDGKAQFEVIVSDLTYVRVGNEWNYICILLDLHNREIVGYSCGRHRCAAGLRRHGDCENRLAPF